MRRLPFLSGPCGWIALAFLPILIISLPLLHSAEFQKAIRPIEFRFPRDHGNHPTFQTEWWYLTGILQSNGKRRWGYQFTLFRQGLRFSEGKTPSPWEATHLYMLHAAISDIKNHIFFHFRDLSRAGPGICGAEMGKLNIWMKTASLRQEGDAWHLSFQGPRFSYRLTLTPTTPPVLHGNRGLSQKGPRPGQATYYYSLPALTTQGMLQTPEGPFHVTGISWFDHEFGTSQLAEDQVGWDWFAIHLSDGSHLMVYQIREKNGEKAPTSSATYIPSKGQALHLTATQFHLTPLKSGWQTVEGIAYPLIWRLDIPLLGLTGTIAPLMAHQAWPGGKGKIPYWEGIVEVKGVKDSAPCTGNGTMELTGYGKRLQWR